MPEPETLDLTNEYPVEDRLVTLPERPYRLMAETAEDRREQTRNMIAFALIVTLGVVLVSTMLYIAMLTIRVEELTADDLIALLQGIGSALLTPLVGLIGAVTGFYYGGQRTARPAARVEERGPTGGSR